MGDLVIPGGLNGASALALANAARPYTQQLAQLAGDAFEWTVEQLRNPFGIARDNYDYYNADPVGLSLPAVTRTSKKAARKTSARVSFRMPKTKRRTAYRRKRKRRSSCYRRKRRRSVRRRRPVKRRRRATLSTRVLPARKRMTFQIRSQIRVQTDAGGWGEISFPANTMERPFAHCNGLIGAGVNPALKCNTMDTNLQQPSGYDRWIDPITAGTTEGKYAHYRVLGSTVTMTHVPGHSSTSGKNYVVGHISTDVTHNYLEAYDQWNKDDLSIFFTAKSMVKAQKYMNDGQGGQRFRADWNSLSHYKRNKHAIPPDPLDLVLRSDGLTAGTFQSPIKIDHRFVIGQLGMQSEGNQQLDFLVTIVYEVELSEPKAFGASVDDLNGAFTSTGVEGDVGETSLG